MLGAEQATEGETVGVCQQLRDGRDVFEVLGRQRISIVKEQVLGGLLRQRCVVTAQIGKRIVREHIDSAVHEAVTETLAVNEAVELVASELVLCLGLVNHGFGVVLGLIVLVQKLRKFLERSHRDLRAHVS